MYDYKNGTVLWFKQFLMKSMGKTCHYYLVDLLKYHLIQRKLEESMMVQLLYSDWIIKLNILLLYSLLGYLLVTLYFLTKAICVILLLIGKDQILSKFHQVNENLSYFYLKVHYRVKEVEIFQVLIEKPN